MEWKKIAKVLLRILWMLAPPTRVEGSKGSKGSKSSKGSKVVPKGHVQEKRKVVSPNKKEEATNESNPLLPQDATNGSNLSEQFRTLQNPQATLRSECAPTVDAPAVVTFG